MLAAGCGSFPAPGNSGTETAGTDDGDGDGVGDDDDDDDDDDDVPDVDPLSVNEPKVARLTDSQYRYTVQDIFGVELTEEEADALPPDIPTGRDYSTTAELQVFTSQYVLGYAEVARSLTARLETEDLVAVHGGCDAVEEGCRPDFIEGLGHRLYRRPLTDDEVERYLELADTIAERAETNEDDVVRGLTQALMQTPQFLYRIEHETDGDAGTVRRVDGWELASRLSYFLWQSTPDEELLEFAAGPDGKGEFDPDALPGQLERMIADAKFSRSRELFWGDYTMATRSNFGGAEDTLADELRDSLLETLARMSGVDSDPLPLSGIFDGQELVMTPAVAEIAGAESVGDGLQVYDAADAEQRTGVVTHPAFLASIGTTSFVGRGLFLSERLLCQHVAEPPDDVAEEIEDTAMATEDMTPREASEFRFGLEPVCLGCHTQFEPVAYAFERYDITGGYTLTDEQGRDLFADGSLPAAGNLPQIDFEDANELLTTLAGEDAVYSCLVENMTEFGTGRRANRSGDFHQIATDTFIDEGLTFEQLLLSTAGSEQLTFMRVVEP